MPHQKKPRLRGGDAVGAPAPVSGGIRQHASVTAREHPERSPCRASPRPDSLANRMRGLPQLDVAHRREIAPVTLVLLRASRSRGVATWRDSPRGASRIGTSVYRVGNHDPSGSYAVIAFTASAVCSPRFFWKTTPCWFTMKVMMPLDP